MAVSHVDGSGRRREKRPAASVSATGASAGISAVDERAVSAEAAELRRLEATLHPALADLPRLPRQGRSREKRQRLLDTAERLFVAHGYAGITADDIAAVAGVSVGTFYNYFHNKRQLLVALTLLRLDDVFTHLRLADMDLAQGDHHEAIHEAVTAVIGGGPQGLRVVWQQMMSLEPELAPYQAAIRRYALDLLASRLRAVREDGGAWPDLDIEGAALAIFSLLDALSVRRDDELPEERVIASVTTLIERAIFPPPSGAAYLRRGRHGNDDE